MSKPRPCTCDNVVLGQALAPGRCKNCWLYHHSLAHHRAWGGQGKWGDGYIVEPSTPPGLLQKVLNFGKAVVQHVATGMKLATPEEKARRLAICEGCAPYWDAKNQRCNHKDCGCNLQAKAGWADQKCPVGKW